ncbi:MFS transporter [Pseudonocardia phyllosphaerae]|uniref:MFS transporter n=1 Tax=Pseudonocardia phyllosphaerae TaxID=3390502 RepID=UPI00397C4700
MTATASARTGAAAPVRIPAVRYVGLLLGVLVGTYGFNVVTATMPQLASELRVGPVGQETVVAAYGIPFAALLILGGRLGDRFGRRALFGIGMGLFALASVAGVLSPGIEMLVVTRVLQGIGAALCTPQVLGTIQATAAPADRVRLIALFGAAGGVGAALGQVLGGVLAGVAPFGSGWRAAYAVAAVLALTSVALSRLAPASRSPRPAAADVAGTLQLLFGILLVVAALTYGPALGRWVTLGVLALGVALLVVLWFHQDRIERSGRIPLLPPGVLRLRPLQLGLVMAALFFAGYGAVLYVATRSIETGLRIDPAETGAMLLPFAVVFAGVSAMIGRIQRRLGDAVLPIGLGLQISGLVIGAVTTALAWGPGLPLVLQPGLVVLGVGQAMVFSPLTQIVVRAIPDSAAGLSGGMFATVQQLALALGVIAYGAVETAFGLDAREGLIAGFAGDAAAAAVVLVLAGVLAATARAARRTGGISGRV